MVVGFPRAVHAWPFFNFGAAFPLLPLHAVVVPPSASSMAPKGAMKVNAGVSEEAINMAVKRLRDELGFQDAGGPTAEVILAKLQDKYMAFKALTVQQIKEADAKWQRERDAAAASRASREERASREGRNSWEVVPAAAPDLPDQQQVAAGGAADHESEGSSFHRALGATAAEMCTLSGKGINAATVRQNAYFEITACVKG